MKKIERQEKMIDEIKMIIGAIVIPNETILNVPIFRQRKEATRKKGYHYELFKEFCDKYTIPYEGIFTELQYEKLLEKRDLLEQFPCFSANFFNNKDLIIENTFGDYDTKGRDILDCFYNEVKGYYGLSGSRK